MEIKSYNKLVRDKIPEIIKSKGDECTLEILSDDRYIEMLDKKLNEELAEYQADKTLEELADLLEVIYSVVKARGYSVEQLEKVRKEKADKRGNFDKKILLKQVTEKAMLTQKQFTQMVTVQSETIDKYIRSGKIIPSESVFITPRKRENYFKKETVIKYAEKYGWTLITEENIKKLFMDFVKKMDMSYSYKPVFLKAMFSGADNEGKVEFSYVVDYFINYYKSRKEEKLPVEKYQSLYCAPDFTRDEVEKNIILDPFKRFENMNFISLDSDEKYLRFHPTIFSQLTKDEIKQILTICDDKLTEYYSKITS